MKSLRISVLAATLLCGANAFALGTFEPYSPGLSNFEVSFSADQAANQVTSALAGYGGGQYFNPAISPTLATTADGEREYAFTLLNSAALYKGDFTLNAIPAFTAARTRSASLGLEWVVPIRSFAPYLQHAHSLEFVEESALAHTLNIGAAYHGFKGMKLFAQLTRAWLSESLWGYDLGFNFRPWGGLELVSSAGQLGSETLHFQLGAVYALE